MPRAAICSGFSQMRMAKVRPPRMSARCTPATARELGLDDAGQVVGDLALLEVSEEKPMYMDANSTSELLSSMTGASASGGRSLRTCATFDWIWVSAALVS